MTENDYKFIYKVYFKGLKKQNDTLLSLTFLNDTSGSDLTDFPHFMLIINDRSRKKTVNSFSNIQEIITLGEASKVGITQFIVVLFTEKKPETPNPKQGILIGKLPDNRFKILGYWPRVVNRTLLDHELNYNILLQNIIDKEEKFDDILIIT